MHPPNVATGSESGVSSAITAHGAGQVPTINHAIGLPADRPFVIRYGSHATRLLYSTPTSTVLGRPSSRFIASISPSFSLPATLAMHGRHGPWTTNHLR
jgi:hypothetical protein